MAVTASLIGSLGGGMETLAVSTSPRMVLHRMGKIVWADVEGATGSMVVPAGWRPAADTSLARPTTTTALVIKANGQFDINTTLPRIVLTWFTP